jgi:DNA polymerase III subunit chi
MAAVQFYHLLTSPLDRALPKLLEKAYAAGYRLLVVTGSEEHAEHLNELLWTYSQDSFLPHGTSKDGHSEDQPIFISTNSESPNSAKLLVVTDGSAPENVGSFERVLDMFDGNNPEALAKARQRWVLYKNNGHSVTYMRQTESGGWEQKAVA